MKLADFLTTYTGTDAEFAETIGVSRQTLWRYKQGDRRPEWDVLERISAATAGAVTPNDFMSGEPKRESAA